jgi:uncharacterized LabA/DUF88 family protein
MRVALFFDGKNHMKDLRRTAQDRWIDHGALAEWTVKHVGGTRFSGAFYYTGVPTAQDEHHDRHALSDLLEELEKRPGFFVKRFNRRTTTRECPHCSQIIAYTEEKMVDTSLVTDLVVYGMQDAFDTAVVFSGDLDIAPGLAALRVIGKQAWVATFGDFGLSKSLVREAWSHIDLLPHIDQFAHPDIAPGLARAEVEIDPAELENEILRELRRAEAHFAAGGGFVGAHYFIHRWKGHGIPEAPEQRRLAVQRLMQVGRIVTYTVDGKTAIKTASDGTVPFPAPSAPGVELGLDELVPEPSGDGVEDDEQTVEMRVSANLVRRLRARGEE